jgi:hypothetical protein
MKETLSNIVLFCSGANVKFLKENCPNERHKFYPIGLGVIITSLLGFISMMFATHSIFSANSIGEEFVLILFSLFWAFAIFTIDWGLVKTMRKPKNQEPTILNRIRYVVPVIFRIIVAIILSYSISRPLEVKVYEKRLRAQIETDRQDYVARELDKKDKKVSERDLKIADLTKQGDEYLDKKNKSPETETFKINIEAQKKCEQELKALKINNDNEIYKLNKEYDNIGSRSKTPTAFEQVTDSQNNTTYPMKSWARNRRRDIKNNEIPRLKKEITDKQNVCEGYAGKVAKEQEEYQAVYDLKIKSNSDQLSSSITNRDSLEKANNEALEKITKASYVSFDTIQPGLITQIESMSNFEKTEEGKSAGWVRFILLLVIICIDTAPIVVKLLTKRGVYEDMQDADEDRMKFLTKQEGYSNNHLISQLASAQKEILTEAVKRWRTKEKDREGMEEDYVNSNQQNNFNGNA